MIALMARHDKLLSLSIDSGYIGTHCRMQGKFENGDRQTNRQTVGQCVSLTADNRQYYAL